VEFYGNDSSGHVGFQAMTTSAKTFTITILGATGIATVAWTAPTTNTAGQTFDNSTNDRTLAAYRIFYGTNQASVESKTSAYVSDPASPYVFTGLASGTWYFLVVAVDGDGDMSLNTASTSKVVA
jgi:hypothetical protein